jgi:hypothetical protein
VGEVRYFLVFTIVKNFEIVLIEIRHQDPMTADGYRHVYYRDARSKGSFHFCDICLKGWGRLLWVHWQQGQTQPKYNCGYNAHG